jgi:hypothetical protein
MTPPTPPMTCAAPAVEMALAAADVADMAGEVLMAEEAEELADPTTPPTPPAPPVDMAEDMALLISDPDMDDAMEESAPVVEAEAPDMAGAAVAAHEQTSAAADWTMRAVWMSLQAERTHCWAAELMAAFCELLHWQAKSV